MRVIPSSILPGKQNNAGPENRDGTRGKNSMLAKDEKQETAAGADNGKREKQQMPLLELTTSVDKGVLD